MRLTPGLWLPLEQTHVKSSGARADEAAMRAVGVFLATTAVALAACTSPSDIIVTESSDSQSPGSSPPEVDPAATEPTTTPTPTTELAAPAGSSTGLFGFLLVEADLPGWDLGRPAATTTEETWTAVDCPAMDTAWAVTGRPGARTRGSTEEARFRQTATAFDTIDEATAVLDAVDRVWVDCNPLTSTLGDFWTEPFELPDAQHRTSGLLLGGESEAGWVLAYWQIDTTVVILEVEGDDLWATVDPILMAATARIEGTPTPLDVPIIETTNTTLSPGPETTPDTVPATAPPVTVLAAFPPVDEEWAQHRLAYLAPHPDTLGEGWEYRYGNLNEASPPDPNELIEGCDAPVPPTLDGVDVEYRRDQDGDVELELILGDGTADDAQTVINAIRGITMCDLVSNGVGFNYDLEPIEIPGAEDAAVISSSWDDPPLTAVASVAVARVDGTVVGAFLYKEGRPSQFDVAVETADIVAGIIAAL